MFYYGLDLSMTKTGVAIFKRDKLHHYELIKPKTTLSNQLKLKAYYDRFSELIELYEPYLVGIERGFTRFNKSTQVIYRVHGVANLAFADYEQIYISPTDVKKTFTGNGKASKADMIDQALKKYRVKVSEDVADAIAVAETLIKGVKNEFHRDDD